MKIHHQGWNETVGAFNCDVTINEEKADHEIHFPNGAVFRQQTPFKDLTADWDRTGKPYSKLGAFFAHNGAAEFFTPLELASLALNGYAAVPGLQIEDRQENLADRIQAAGRRAKALADTQKQVPDRAAPVPIR